MRKWVYVFSCNFSSYFHYKLPFAKSWLLLLRSVIWIFIDSMRIENTLCWYYYLLFNNYTHCRNDPSNQNLSDYFQSWKIFLNENRDFIEHFDFIRLVFVILYKILSCNFSCNFWYFRDLAVEDPGDSPVIMAKWENIFDCTDF